VLAASLLHATWHALVKSSGDRVIALAGMNLVSGATAVAVIPFVAPPTWSVSAVIAGSVLLHGSYKVALAKLYSRADLSQGYPLARGLTPIVATLLAVLLLREIPNSASLVGVLLIALGVAGLVLERGSGHLAGGAGALSFSAIAAAVAAGTAVAAYSVVDAYGIRASGDWLGFTAWLIACDSAAFVGYALATRRSEVVRTWCGAWQRTLISGLLGTVSFGVFMWALARAQVGAVAALRETSVIFASLLGGLFLGERMSWMRFSSAAIVMSGVAAISFLR
jgi:drug/metabolite transporter (DMT)-like permease